VTTADLAAFAAVKQGFLQGSGPFWDTLQLCGRPLFGVWGLPWSGALAPLLFLAGPWMLSLLAFSGTALLWLRGPRRRWSFSFGLLSLASFCFMPLGFKAGLALAPWALLAFWDAPFAAAALCLALLLSTLSLGPVLAVLALTYRLRPDNAKRQWMKRVCWAVGLALPALLPALTRNTVAMELGRAWPLVTPAETAAAISWACFAALFLSAPPSGLKARLSVGSLGLGLALAIGVFLSPRSGQPSKNPISQLPFNMAYSRYADAAGSPQALATAVGGDGDQLQLVGSLDGRGPLASIRRWQEIAQAGPQSGDLLSLANVGWFKGGPGQGQGQRWSRPVGAALVDDAISAQSPDQTNHSGLFEQPLRVEGDLPIPEGWKGSTWHLFSLDRIQGSHSELGLPASQHDAWLFFSQSFDRGWQVKLQDAQGHWRQGKVIPTEGGFLAVALQTGDRAATLDYRQPFFGLLLAFSLIILAFLGWTQRGFLFDRR
jgi:hypothetical protein